MNQPLIPELSADAYDPLTRALERATQAAQEYAVALDAANAAVVKYEFEELWAETLSLAREAPYAYGSHRRAHLDASKEIASQRGLQGEVLAAWGRFVQEKTASLSVYAGD